MATLRGTRQWIITSDDPAQILDLTDRYLQQREKMGRDFRVPTDHEYVEPMVDAFAGELGKWLAFIESVRDQFPNKSTIRLAIQAVHRRVSTRLWQQQRRERLDRVVELAIRKRVIKDVYAEKMAFADTMTKFWISRKMNLLRMHKGLTVETRRPILDEFWANIDAEIANGELRKP